MLFRSQISEYATFARLPAGSLDPSSITTSGTNMLSSPKDSVVKSLSRVRLLATPWTVAHQAPPSMGFSRQEYWSGLPFPSPCLRIKSSFLTCRRQYLNLMGMGRRAGTRGEAEFGGCGTQGAGGAQLVAGGRYLPQRQSSPLEPGLSKPQRNPLLQCLMWML